MALATAGAYRIDDDGRLRSSQGCELNVVHHCNLTCTSCSHLSPIFKRSLLDPEQAYEDLSALARHFRPRFVKLLGGEPLLHPELLALIDAVRAAGISDTLLACTNGVRLPRMPAEFWQRVDEVEVSQYPGHELGEAEIRQVVASAREHGVELRLVRYGSFRLSHAERGTSDDDLVRRIYTTCQVAHVWRCHTVYDHHVFRCPQSIFLPLALDGEVDYADGLPIEDEPGFAERLLAYLSDPEPLAACRRCLGTVGELREHGQERRPAWREPQAGTSEDLIDYEQLQRLERSSTGGDGCVADERVFSSDGPSQL